jgi:hypothetical protein
MWIVEYILLRVIKLPLTRYGAYQALREVLCSDREASINVPVNALH